MSQLRMLPDSIETPPFAEKPEERLLLAINTRAVHDYLSETSPSLAKNAREWLFSNSHSSDEFSFDFKTVCHLLDIDTLRLQKQLLEVA